MIINKKAVFIISVLLFFGLMFAVIFLLFLIRPSVNSPTPLPTPVTNKNNTSSSNNYQIDSATTLQFQRQYVIDEMTKSLPYYGSNFSLFYNSTTNRYTLQLNQLNTSGGNIEFTAFLKKAGIMETSWLHNLDVVHK